MFVESIIGIIFGVIIAGFLAVSQIKKRIVNLEKVQEEHRQTIVTEKVEPKTVTVEKVEPTIETKIENKQHYGPSQEALDLL